MKSFTHGAFIHAHVLALACLASKERYIIPYLLLTVSFVFSFLSRVFGHLSPQKNRAATTKVTALEKLTDKGWKWRVAPWSTVASGIEPPGLFIQI